MRPSQQSAVDPSVWQSNQRAASSSYSSAADSSAAVCWPQPSKPRSSSSFTHSSRTFTTPTQLAANPSTASGFQQQNMASSQAAQQQNLLLGQMAPQQNVTSTPQRTLMPSQVTPGVSVCGDGMSPSQSAVHSGSTYGWSSATSAAQWQTQAQWSWVQGNNQWPSSQPLQYMVCHSCIYCVNYWQFMHMV